MVVNTFNTSYPLVDLVAQELGFRTAYKDHNLTAYGEARYNIRAGEPVGNAIPDFDVVWFDTPQREEVLTKLKPYQRIS